MKPILFPKNETAYSTNGLGILAEAVECYVEEERNGTYMLTLLYPTNGSLYEQLDYDLQILAKPNEIDREQPFRIVDISDPIEGIVTYTAEHIVSDTNGIPVFPFKASSVAEAAVGMMGYSAVSNPFTFSTSKASTGSFAVTVPTSFRALLNGVQGSVLDSFGGGEYHYDRYNITLHQNRGADNGVVLEYGQNIESFTRNISIANMITGVAPYWADSEGKVVTLSEKVLQVANTLSHPAIVCLDLSEEFDEAPTQAQLRAKAKSRLESSENLSPSVNITVNFVALWQVDEYKEHPAYKALANLTRLSLCDTATIRIPKRGLEVKEKLIRYEWDVLNERYSEMELGEPLSTSTNTLNLQEHKLEEKPTFDFLVKAILNATTLLTGHKGGHVVMSPAPPAEPQEIFIMDTPSISTAKRIWRWNLNGLGYSKNGINGPYETAITADGAIVANFITAGTLSANIIRAGVIADVKGKNRINLETGDATMSGSFTSTNGTASSIISSGEFTLNEGTTRLFRIYRSASGRVSMIFYNAAGENQGTIEIIEGMGMRLSAYQYALRGVSGYFGANGKKSVISVNQISDSNGGTRDIRWEYNSTLGKTILVGV